MEGDLVTVAANESSEKTDGSGSNEQDEFTVTDVEVKCSSDDTPSKSNLKRMRDDSETPEQGQEKRRKSVGFVEAKPQVEVFEIEPGNHFKKLPTTAKLKSMAGRWSNPFSISRVPKKFRVDEFEPEEEKKEEKKVEKKVETVAVDTSKMSDEQKEAYFMKVSKKAYMDIANGPSLLKLNAMVPALKATGLMEFMKAKHGATRKWFTLQTKVFGLSADNFISMRGHNDEFRDMVLEMLNKQPKKMMKLHLIEQELRSLLSESGLRKSLKGYTNLHCYILAHSTEFIISQKGDFVTVKKEFLTKLNAP